jgi:membrane-anchored mycosin MYCP
VFRRRIAAAVGLVGIALSVAAPGRAIAAGAADPGSSCASPAPGSPGQTPWAQLRLAPQQAWSRTRGDDVTVAVIDSGVDAKVPALAGHVAAGVDVTTGKSGADSDCLGHGTAMAAIIAAQPRKDSRFVGMAPGAIVLPIRVTIASTAAQPAHVRTAIEVAVSAGAAVIMVGVPIDVTDRGLAAAISGAVNHNVVIVVAARAGGPDDALGSAPSTMDSSINGALRVGAIGADDRIVGSYPAGAVDVLAPGAGIVSLGANGSGEIHGSGSDFAVSFVAGLAALVRARFPELSATDTVRQIEQTADHMGTALPDARFGWGTINTAAAVGGDPVAESPRSVEPVGEPDHWLLRVALLVIVWISAAAGVIALTRRQRANNPEPDRDTRDQGGGRSAPEPPGRYVPDRQGQPVRGRHVQAR